MSTGNGDTPKPDEQRIAEALAPFGWTCTDEFWRRYYTDPWVFNLANAVGRLTDQLGEALAIGGGPE